METWLSSGQVKYREYMVEGLEAAPEALYRIAGGQNFGKMLIKVDEGV